MIDKFAPVRFCDQCQKDVDVVFRDKTVPFTVYGEKVDITYKASFCPVCGQAVCERDFDDALERYVQEHHQNNDLWPKEDS